MANLLCVLTGDIVDSRTLEATTLDAVMDALTEAAETVRGWSPGSGRPLERFRGDGWQLTLADPCWALRACLLLRAAVRAHTEHTDTRIAVGIDAGTLGARLSTSHGPAFEHSGKALETLKGRSRWAVHAAFTDPSAQVLVRGLFRVCDALSQTWTDKQAEALALRIVPDTPTMDAIAERLGVTQQTIQAHLARAFGDTLGEACTSFEAAWAAS